MGTVLVLIPATLRYCARSPLDRRALDLHHAHKIEVPRLGGISLAVAFTILNLGLLLLSPDRVEIREAWILPVTSLAMFGLGLWDDLRPLGAKWKLLGQILIASSVCISGHRILMITLPFSGQVLSLGAGGVLLTILWLVGMTNLINFIDGADGVAGGICFMLMGLLAYVGHQNGNFELIAAGMAGAVLGFLCFNFPPARIYLGDGGAYMLGFQIGLLALVGSQKGTILAGLVAPLFVLALPILDMVLAISRRGLCGLPIFRPDRRHIHHRLLEIGFSQRKVVLSIYGITLVFLSFGLVVFVSGGHWVPTLTGIVTVVLLICAGKLSFSREWFAVGHMVGNSLEKRREIQSTLCLTRWLALQGARHPSITSLWPEFVFVAQRLGFSSARLMRADGERVWRVSHADPGPLLSFRQELGGQSGVLELQTRGIRSSGSPPAPGEEPTGTTPPAHRPICDPALFRIISELLVEGWLKATSTRKRSLLTNLWLRLIGWSKVPHPKTSALSIEEHQRGARL